MRYQALATDYDGTLARDGHVDEETLVALRRLRESRRKLILVTGRQLEELQVVFPQLDLCDAVVAENGAVLFWPESCREEVIGQPVPAEFVAEMDAAGVKPYSVGNGIFATWRPYETVVQAAIQRLGIDFHIIFNKQAVMVLPNNVTKATGLIAALKQMSLPAPAVVGVGDAENDFAFLRMCGLSVAVANALPSLKQACDLVTRGDHGQGVSELIAELVDTDLLYRARRPPDPTGQPLT